MFAIFQYEGKKKKRISDPYCSPVVARDLCKRMNDQMEGEFKVRQKVKEEGDTRAHWKDL